MIQSRLSDAISFELYDLMEWCKVSWHLTACSSAVFFIDSFTSSLGDNGRLWPPAISSKQSLFDLAHAMARFWSQPPNCHPQVPGESYTCSTGLRWQTACARINDAGKNALLEMESLSYSHQVDRHGNLVGFETEGAASWRWFQGKRRS